MPKASLKNGVVDSGNVAVAGVPRFEKGWWARLDSNQRPKDYESSALTN